jgi:hypothetical protein
MAYLTRDDTSFNSAVDRWFHYRSSRLKELMTSLKSYQAGADKARLEDLLAKMRTWKTSDPNEYTKRGKNTGAYKQLLAEVKEAGQKYRGFNFGVEPPEPNTGGHSPLTTVMNVSRELNDMKTWACLDAKNFAIVFSKLSKDKKKEIFDRETAAKQRGGGATITGTGAATVVGRNTWGQICTTARGCIQRKTAVCFSFAQSSAFIIGGKGTTCRENPRVEIVSLNNHVIVIVGREGGFLVSQGKGRGGAETKILRKTVLPPPAEWGAGTVVVDGWLGSLGFDVIYPTWFDFPYNNAPGSNALISFYDNHSEE